MPLLLTSRLPALSILPLTLKSVAVSPFVIVVSPPFVMPAPTLNAPVPSLIICNESAFVIVPFTVALFPLFRICVCVPSFDNKPPRFISPFVLFTIKRPLLFLISLFSVVVKPPKPLFVICKLFAFAITPEIFNAFPLFVSSASPLFVIVPLTSKSPRPLFSTSKSPVLFIVPLIDKSLPAFVISLFAPLITSPVTDRLPVPLFLTTKSFAVFNVPPNVKSVPVAPLIMFVIPSLSTVPDILSAPLPLLLTSRLPSLSIVPDTLKSVPAFVISV